MKRYKLIDGSGSLRITATGLEKPGNIVDDKEYCLIASQLDLPADENMGYSKGRRNNVMLRDIDSGDVILSQYKYIREIERKPIVQEGVVNWEINHSSYVPIGEPESGNLNFKLLVGKKTKIRIEEIIEE